MGGNIWNFFQLRQTQKSLKAWKKRILSNQIPRRETTSRIQKGTSELWSRRLKVSDQCLCSMSLSHNSLHKTFVGKTLLPDILCSACNKLMIRTFPLRMHSPSPESWNYFPNRNFLMASCDTQISEIFDLFCGCTDKKYIIIWKHFTS